MSIATVHYLSMNTGGGQITIPAVTHAVSATFTGASLTPSLSHKIVCGDGTSDTTLTTSGTGTFSTTHTYTTAGTYNMVMSETASGRVVSRDPVVAA